MLKYILIFILISFLTYFFLLSSRFEIKNISIELNDKNIKNENLMKKIEKFKGKNIFLVNESNIEKELINAEEDRIAFIKIEKELPNEIKVIMQEYKDSANISIKIKDGVEKKFVLNQNGKISKENIHIKELPLIIMKSNTQTEISNFSLKKDELAYIIEAKKYFEEKFNIATKIINYYQIEHEVHLITEKGFEVWLDIDQPYLTQLHALKISLSKLDIYNTKLKYIDLRVTNGQKVIFKKL